MTAPTTPCLGMRNSAWWRHHIETLSTLPALCEENPPVNGDPLILTWMKWKKRAGGWSFETHRQSRDVTVMSFWKLSWRDNQIGWHGVHYRYIFIFFFFLVMSWNRETHINHKWTQMLFMSITRTEHTTFRLSYLPPLRWHHNGRDGVSNHQPHDFLLNSLFGRRSKKTSKFRVTGLCAGSSRGTGEFPAQMASNAENVSIWWRHHTSAPHATEHALKKTILCGHAHAEINLCRHMYTNTILCMQTVVFKIDPVQTFSNQIDYLQTFVNKVHSLQI